MEMGMRKGAQSQQIQKSIVIKAREFLKELFMDHKQLDFVCISLLCYSFTRSSLPVGHPLYRYRRNIYIQMLLINFVSSQLTDNKCRLIE